MEEMISGLFLYENKTCRGLVATYHKCTLLQPIESVNPGTQVDEITIDYNYGTMELAQTTNISKVLAEVEINVFIDNGEPFSEGYPQEEAGPPPQFMDATVALAMVSQKAQEARMREELPAAGGMPDYSDQFVNEEGQREPPVKP